MAAAHGGVSRFDGEEFRTYGQRDGVPSERVTCLLKDRRERLWFAGSQGVICWYDGRQFHAVEPFEHSRGFIQCMAEDRQGRIWFWGAGALAYWDEHDRCDLLPAYEQQFGARWRYCWGMAHDQAGHVWLGGDRLVRLDGQHFQVCGPEMGLPDQHEPFVVGQDAQNGIWFAGSGRILRFDGEVFQSLPGEYPGIARCIRADREGRLWVSLSGGGTYYVQEDKVHLIEVGVGTAGVAVDVFQDREGLLWFSTWGGGIRCCDPHSVQSFALPDGSGAGHLLFDRRGCLWMNTGDGIGWLSGSGQVECRHSGLRLGKAMCADSQGQLWCGGNDGLARWDETRQEMVEASEREQRPRVTAIAIDAQGRLVFSHDSAGRADLCVVRVENGTYQGLLQLPKGYPESCFTRILPSRQGHLWLALGGWFGLVGGSGGVARLEEDGQVVWYRGEEGLVDPRVEDLCEDRRGRLWIATRGGISCLDGESCTNLTEKDGLPASGVLCVHEDQQGDLWFGGEDCVVRYDGHRLQVIRSPSIRGAVRSITQDPDGSLWFATSSGVVRYVPTEIPPKVRLLRVMGDRTYETDEAVEIPASSGQVIFEFKGIGLRTTVRGLLYTYRLSGLDTGWQSATRERQAMYPELPPGDYIFSVKAIDRDLNESDPASIQVRVVPDPRIQGLAEALGSAGADDFIGDSPALRRVQTQLMEVARTDLTVLILGETGTGKGLAARTVHAASPRQSGPLIQINCGALPEALVESELFGHEKGAFTGAHARKLGRVELAQGGTLFLARDRRHESGGPGQAAATSRRGNVRAGGRRAEPDNRCPRGRRHQPGSGAAGRGRSLSG